MKIALDVHTHTVASGHAFSSLQEMAKAAAEKQIQILGITDHGPSIEGACKTSYFRNFHVVPRSMYGVRILMGAEINILDTYGRLDLSDQIIDNLDIRVAGIHSHCFEQGSRSENTKAMIRVIENPRIDIISHPADGSADLDLEEIVLAAKDNRILLEINNSSLNPNRGKTLAWENNRKLVRLCKKHNLMVIMGSDAHISFDIAKYNYVQQLFQEEEFPDSLVINDKPDLFMQVLQRM